jgi:hypothetical protein
MRKMLFMGCAVLASGCVVREVREPPPPVVYREPAPPPPPPAYQPPPQYSQPQYSQPQYGQPVQQDPGWESVQIEPPMEQPAPVAIPYAPPPMVWDPPPPRPWVEAVWVGGHWSWWNGEWVWARGYWARAPNPGWVYTEPYYEYRGDAVVFVAGFWRPSYRVFVPPPPTVYIPVVQVRVVHVGYVRPVGPHGVFIPAPPGSLPGVIVPCPVGTPPAVVLSAPPVVRAGMVVRPVPSRGGFVEVYAPAGVTREGRPVTAQAPAVSHDAASVHPVVVTAPPPVRNDQFPGHVVNRPAPLPGPQSANVGGTPIATPVPSNSGSVQVRPLPPAPAGQPPVQPALRPEAMGGQPGPRPWSNGQGRENEGPILRPDQRGQDMPPRPQPAQSDPPVVRQPTPVTPAPPPAVSAASRPLPPGQARKLEPAPGRANPPVKKVDPGERRGHPEAREQ